MLNENFRDILSAFDAENVEYLLVGAYAMAAYGCPRATGDIDFWVNPSAANASRVWSALIRFGAPLGRVTESDFSKLDVVYQMGLPPQRIDLLTSIDGVAFGDAWANRLHTEVGGVAVNVIGKSELRQNKLATGRDKDIRDVAVLDRMPG